jgi:hypothetical protein
MLSAMKIRPVEEELLHKDGRTDGQEEANKRFSKFCELVTSTLDSCFEQSLL